MDCTKHDKELVWLTGRCCDGAALKRTGAVIGASVTAAPGAGHNLEVHNDHSGKGEEPGKIAAVQAGGDWGVRGGCVGQGFVL